MYRYQYRLHLIILSYNKINIYKLGPHLKISLTTKIQLKKYVVLLCTYLIYNLHKKLISYTQKQLKFEKFDIFIASTIDSVD